jgi:hypothetical protein
MCAFLNVSSPFEANWGWREAASWVSLFIMFSFLSAYCFVCLSYKYLMTSLKKRSKIKQVALNQSSLLLKIQK